MSLEAFGITFDADFDSASLKLVAMKIADGTDHDGDFETSFSSIKKFSFVEFRNIYGHLDRLKADGWIKITEAEACGWKEGKPDDVFIRGLFLPCIRVRKQRRSAQHTVRPQKKPKPLYFAPTKEKRERIYKRDGYKCHYCGSKARLSLDHIVPQIKGGSHDDSNLVTACKSCNSAKRDKSYDEFISALVLGAGS